MYMDRTAQKHANTLAQDLNSVTIFNRQPIITANDKSLTLETYGGNSTLINSFDTKLL